MFISYPELVVMTLCSAVILFMIVVLFASNYMLLKENRFLRSRLRAWRQSCANNHAEIPF